jgi:hypothetical protein
LMQFVWFDFHYNVSRHLQQQQWHFLFSVLPISSMTIFA